MEITFVQNDLESWNLAKLCKLYYLKSDHRIFDFSHIFELSLNLSKLWSKLRKMGKFWTNVATFKKIQEFHALNQALLIFIALRREGGQTPYFSFSRFLCRILWSFRWGYWKSSVFCLSDNKVRSLGWEVIFRTHIFHFLGIFGKKGQILCAKVYFWMTNLMKLHKQTISDTLYW